MAYAFTRHGGNILHSAIGGEGRAAAQEHAAKGQKGNSFNDGHCVLPFEMDVMSRAFGQLAAVLRCREPREPTAMLSCRVTRVRFGSVRQRLLRARLCLVERQRP